MKYLAGISLVFAFHSSAFSAPSNACDIVNLFSGQKVLSKTFEPPSDSWEGFELYLLVSLNRSVGIGASRELEARLDAILTPARWGYDINLPNGTPVGMVYVQVADPSLPKGVYEVDPKYGLCSDDTKVFLHRDKRGNFKVTFQGNVIGFVSNKFKEFTEY